MIVSLEKPGTPQELVHVGVKGMHWGIRKQEETSGQTRTGMSRKKKIAIGVGIAVGVGAAAYVLHRHGQNKLSSIDKQAIEIGKKYAMENSQKYWLEQIGTLPTQSSQKGIVFLGKTKYPSGYKYPKL